MLEETLLHLPFSSQRPGYTALGQNRHSCCCLAGISRICLLWGSKCTSGLTVHLLFNSWLLVSSLKGSDVSSPQDNGFSPGRPEFPSALTRLQGSGLQANVWVSRPLHSPLTGSITVRTGTSAEALHHREVVIKGGHRYHPGRSLSVVTWHFEGFYFVKRFPKWESLRETLLPCLPLHFHYFSR